MKKVLFSLITLAVYSALLAQNHAQLQVIDIQTKRPIIYANVFCPATGYGEITNNDGIAQLDMDKVEGILLISYIGYQTVRLEPNSTEHEVVEMETNSYELSEVKVLEHRPTLDGMDIIKLVLENIEANYESEVTIWNAKYSETYECNQEMVYGIYSNTSIKYQGYPQKRYARKAFRRYFEKDCQNSNQPTGYCGQFLPFGNPLFFRYHTSVNDSVFVQSIERTENKLEDKHYFLSFGGPASLLAQDKVKYLSDMLDQSVLDDYHIEIESVIEVDNHLEYILTFRPKPESDFGSVLQNQKMKYAILSGRIFVGHDDYSVRKVECQLANRKGFLFYMLDEPWQVFPSSSMVEVWYDKYEGGYGLSRVVTTQHLNGINISRWGYHEDFGLVRELVREENIPRIPSHCQYFQEECGMYFVNMIVP